MLYFSNCKINIGLHVVHKRADGYHDIETIFYPLPNYDVLELLPATQTDITIAGNNIPGEKSDNIIFKAYQLLKKDFELPPVHFYLLKNIPVGAGLGAGSANGAYALKALNEMYELNLTTQQLLSYCLQLGSDCPFFIQNQPCFATGRGENFSEVNINLSAYNLVIVNPGIHISTPWAFKNITPQKPRNPLQQSILQPITEWKHTITNDFETAVFNAHPEIGGIKKTLYDAGAIFSLMSGSGSTVYGIFEKDREVQLNFADRYLVKIIPL